MLRIYMGWEIYKNNNEYKQKSNAEALNRSNEAKKKNTSTVYYTFFIKKKIKF